MKNDLNSACLYVVATPIGNIEDISARAIETLKQVVLIAAEDTRHSQRLCQHYGINTPMISLHEHNEESRVAQIAAKLDANESIALISDAGTPLISDPGFKLVRALREQGYKVSPVPGPSAIITALSVAGLPTDSFSFFGFLPAKSSSRKQRYLELGNRTETMVFYESSHRIAASLQDALETLGNRHAVVARELTKTFETILDAPLIELVDILEQDHNQSKGEFVLMISGVDKKANNASIDSERLLKELLKELPPNKASKIVSNFTGISKKEIYQIALDLKESSL
ncbi:16S rRNA (cytidine(1402)-2'-O)-methyltransferase [Kangiella sp. HZ709]|uniref:16S rRNA (cytidine(1402)-2'-O)-methyltransferase n=1 Tax=Kangiella sp. HZ709 TaxID=2666328 RepID=UPI0012B03BF4|nr:16S rRNA (cytidine(1402)-2'-O)-methyltransferase [Kangiella sp. HZ709]MRX27436.1 16S rRNA (cytidine(1402)-2'-O)-methyltransferase [Kangiella sp. HZ709]